jgi:hypothetical protein
MTFNADTFNSLISEACEAIDALPSPVAPRSVKRGPEARLAARLDECRSYLNQFGGKAPSSAYMKFNDVFSLARQKV